MDELSLIEKSLPKQIQCVWDNINLRTNPRYQRQGDTYSDYNKDWMLSMWIKERIDAYHMDHVPGVALKTADELCIEDFIPCAAEKEYLFSSHVHYFAEAVTRRFPVMFSSLKSSIKVNKPHQFEKEMSSPSEEFSGDLFTKSESNTEDLISMMQEIQEKYVHKDENALGVTTCYEKKVISGDNKTEKNSHYGIPR